MDQLIKGIILIGYMVSIKILSYSTLILMVPISRLTILVLVPYLST